MNVTRIERRAAVVGAALAFGAVLWTALGPEAFPWYSVVLAVVAVGTALTLLLWLAKQPEGWRDRVVAWALGGGATLVMGLGSAADYDLWFADSRWWTVGCHGAALVLVAGAGWKRGWSGGLRAALVAQLGSTVVLLALFRWNLGQPVQAAVFQAAGLLDAYEANGSVDFTRWVTNEFLATVLLRGAVALGAGAALGGAVARLRARLRPPLGQAPRAKKARGPGRIRRSSNSPRL